MKLRMILEDDNLVKQQSLKSVRLAVLRKLRMYLVSLGLSKTKNTKNTIVEAIPEAYELFNNIITLTDKKLKNHISQAEKYPLNSPIYAKMGEIWGYNFPTNYYDVTNTQSGRGSTNGQLDDILISCKPRNIEELGLKERLSALSLVLDKIQHLG